MGARPGLDAPELGSAVAGTGQYRGLQKFGCTPRSRCSRAWRCGRANGSMPRPHLKHECSPQRQQGKELHRTMYNIGNPTAGGAWVILSSLSAGAVSRSVSQSTKCNCPCALLPSVNKSAQSAPRRPPAHPPARPTDDLSMCVCVCVQNLGVIGFAPPLGPGIRNWG